MKLADKYALISQEIKQLEIERDKLRVQLLALKQETVAGDHCDITFTTRDTIKLDPKVVYGMLKPSRFFQLVSVKTAEAKKVLSDKEFAQATVSTTSSDVVLVKPRVAALHG